MSAGGTAKQARQQTADRRTPQWHTPTPGGRDFYQTRLVSAAALFPPCLSHFSSADAYAGDGTRRSGKFQNDKCALHGGTVTTCDNPGATRSGSDQREDVCCNNGLRDNTDFGSPYLEHKGWRSRFTRREAGLADTVPLGFTKR